MHRIKTYFYILKDRANAIGEVPICCRISMKSARSVLSTGLKVHPKQWNQVRQQIEDLSVFGNQKNRKLEQFQAHIYMYHSNKDVKLSIVNDENHKSLVSMIDDHNKSMEKQIGIRYSEVTLKNYRTLIRHITTFLEQEFTLNFPLIRVDSSFVYRFEAFLLEETKCNNNGALKVLQRLKKDHKK